MDEQKSHSPLFWAAGSHSLMPRGGGTYQPQAGRYHTTSSIRGPSLQNYFQSLMVWKVRSYTSVRLYNMLWP